MLDGADPRLGRAKSRFSSYWDKAKSRLLAYLKMKSLKEDISIYGVNVRPKNKEMDEITSMKDTIGKVSASRLLIRTKSNKIWYLIYPDSKLKNFWSFVSIFLLLYTSFITPYRICFLDSVPGEFIVLEWFIDSFILIDIVINIFSVYVNEDGEQIANLRKQFMIYLKTWLLIDLLSIFPFQLFRFGSEGDQYNDLIKILRLPRLYRLIRIARMVKALQKVKKNKYIQWLQDVIHLHQGVLRMLNFILLVIIVVHLFGCLWYLAAKFADFGPTSWLFKYP